MHRAPLRTVCPIGRPPLLHFFYKCQLGSGDFVSGLRRDRARSSMFLSSFKVLPFVPRTVHRDFFPVQSVAVPRSFVNSVDIGPSAKVSAISVVHLGFMNR